MHRGDKDREGAVGIRRKVEVKQGRGKVEEEGEEADGGVVPG